MLLFPKEEHERVKSGGITVTFRDWDKLRVEAGKEYKSFNLGFVRVDEIGYVDFKKVTEQDLRDAGIENAEEFKTIFRKRNPGFNFGSGKLIRIKFTYLGPEQSDAGGLQPNDRELIRIMERLVEIDVMSELDIKSDELLASLSQDAAQNTLALSKRFSVPQAALKKRMTELKNEGLVDSRRDGYVVTVRGKAYLDSKI